MITTDLLRRAVELRFGAEAGHRVDLETATIEELPSTGGGSFNTTVQRIIDPSDNWSVIVKHIVGSPSHVGWDRESRVHADSDWLDRHLPDGLMPPRLLAQHHSGRDVTLVFEDLGPRRTLTDDDLIAAATLLSTFNSSGADHRDWWSTNFLVTEYHELADRPDLLEATQGDQQLESLRQQLLALGAQGPDLLASLDSLPIGPAHLDAYSRNLVAGDTIGLIDWSNAGAAPLGADPATLLVLTLGYLDADASSIAQLEASIIEAMALGLLDNNAEQSTASALTGFRAISRLRHLAMMMNAFPMVEQRDPAVSSIVGQPLDRVVEQWLAVGDHLLST